MWPRCPVFHLGHEQVPLWCGKPDARLWRQERMTVASCPECRGLLQGGQRRWLLSFVNGCNAVTGAAAEPSACGLQPVPPASSQPTGCAALGAWGCSPAAHKTRCKPWWTQPGAGKAWDEATLALANCVCMSFPSTCQGETCRKAAPT